MGHIQVALTSLAGAGDCGVGRGVDDADRTKASLGEAYFGVGLLNAGARFAFGNSVTFGDDFKNPA